MKTIYLILLGLQFFAIGGGWNVTSAVADSCRLTVDDARVSVRIPGVAVQAAHMTLGNNCSSSIIITGARTDQFGMVMLHETRTVDGISSMRHVERLEIKPGDVVQLKPGGLHMMLMNPGLDVGARDLIQIELLIEGAEPQKIMVYPQS